LIGLAVILGVHASTEGASDPSIVNYKPDVFELCALVGENSGCSGCTIGTVGLCSWMEVFGPLPSPWPNPINPRLTVSLASPAAGLSVFQCVPTRYARAAILQKSLNFFPANQMCPADANKEPLVRENLQWLTPGRSSVGITGTGPWNVQNASVVWSRSHTRRFIEFHSKNWTVDRTSRWGRIGGLIRSAAIGHSFEQANFYWDNIGALDCGNLNSRNDMLQNETVQNSGDNATRVNVLNELVNMCPTGTDPATNQMYVTYNAQQVPFWTERDRWCTRLYLNTAASARCPQYGRPISGICQTAYLMSFLNCNKAVIQTYDTASFNNIVPNNYFWSAVGTQVGGPYPTPASSYGLIAGMRVVDDSTPWCLMDWPLEITNEFETYIGINAEKSLREMNDATVGTTILCKNVGPIAVP